MVADHVTLDGVMQAPARADEDTRDGFAHGGWAAERADAALVAKIGERIGEGAAFLFGRRTYEDFHRVWGSRTDNEFSRAFEDATKYVASRELTEPLPWAGSVLLDGDAAAAVAELRRGDGGNLAIFGSGELVDSLMAAELVDEYLLMIHPLVLGEGRRLFGPGREARLRLLDSVATPAGVVLATYAPAAG